MTRPVEEWTTRYYTRSGHVAHLVPMVGAPNEAAMCRRVWPWTWYGTGSQAEYERAAALPLCKACAKAVAQ